VKPIAVIHKLLVKAKGNFIYEVYSGSGIVLFTRNSSDSDAGGLTAIFGETAREKNC
jgi:hypothetical protein